MWKSIIGYIKEQRPLLLHILLIEKNSFSSYLSLVYYREFERQFLRQLLT